MILVFSEKSNFYDYRFTEDDLFLSYLCCKVNVKLGLRRHISFICNVL